MLYFISVLQMWKLRLREVKQLPEVTSRAVGDLSQVSLTPTAPLILLCPELVLSP